MLVVLDFDVVRRFYRLGRRESRLARLLLPDHADMRHAVRLPERGREEIRAAHDADLDDVTGKVELEIGLENLFNERRALTSSRRMNPENRGIYTQSDSSKKSSRNIWSLAVVSVDQRY